MNFCLIMCLRSQIDCDTTVTVYLIYAEEMKFPTSVKRWRRNHFHTKQNKQTESCSQLLSGTSMKMANIQLIL